MLLFLVFFGGYSLFHIFKVCLQKKPWFCFYDQVLKHFHGLYQFYCLTHFQPMFHFYTPQNIRKPEVSDVFREYRSETLVENGLKSYYGTTIHTSGQYENWDFIKAFTSARLLFESMWLLTLFRPGNFLLTSFVSVSTWKSKLSLTSKFISSSLTLFFHMKSWDLIYGYLLLFQN